MSPVKNNSCSVDASPFAFLRKVVAAFGGFPLHGPIKLLYREQHGRE
jgi:hypothetical protein